MTKKRELTEERRRQVACLIDESDLYTFKLFALKHRTTTGQLMRDFIKKFIETVEQSNDGEKGE